ncbi:MAG TPA: NAD(P)H-hydrate epimerase [Anaerohalosphaeraceae bacterium]|jgi:hydroxyethylthiazole kinase-like uncharacterized protein yjeF|nr:NAD(P)H-hydrate epimerase [Anaerohalosphaeraceae bacterium]HRT49114.1 NAD(P)H-hydrate epimerase [Anaerohalosphaeraceae bacterium]HRT85633.1 NAD(P)H-hydrate epimerase [Anaerohalosphaeraceae bacterium]
MTVQKVIARQWADYTIMTRRQVRDFDAWAIQEMGIPGVVLMENAGRGCTEVICDRLGAVAEATVAVFCGVGNNGGDGYVIARHLANCGASVRVVVCGKRDKIGGDALTNLKIIERMDLPVVHLNLLPEGLPDRVAAQTEGCALLVDALFGTGLSGELHSEYAGLIACINAQDIPIVAVDIPSGLDCDTGMPLPVCIEADATVTFVAVKKGFTLSEETLRATGQIYVASIGIDPRPR